MWAAVCGLDVVAGGLEVIAEAVGGVEESAKVQRRCKGIAEMAAAGGRRECSQGGIKSWRVHSMANRAGGGAKEVIVRGWIESNVVGGGREGPGGTEGGGRDEEGGGRESACVEGEGRSGATPVGPQCSLLRQSRLTRSSPRPLCRDAHRSPPWIRSQICEYPARQCPWQRPKDPRRALLFRQQGASELSEGVRERERFRSRRA